ncbi:MAG: hypothetical protein EPN21_01475 [Methylococcaceae bacterium]|nr:MAG: hypothetical protein EPN21_01475 [Methylococcaceae bacterium]
MNQRVLLDLNAPTFQADFVRLEAEDLKQTAKTLRKLLGMTWDVVYRDTGLKWEEIRSSKGTYTLRISRKCRAIVVREGDFMRFLAIHADHNGAYENRGS